jgi:hypothetical protein
MVSALEQYRSGLTGVPIPEDNPPYLNANKHYRITVKNVILRESKKEPGVVFQVAELIVMESNDPAFPANSEASWTVRMGHVSTPGNRAAFFLAVGQQSYDGFTSDNLVDKFIRDHCVIEGDQAEPYTDGSVILGVKTKGQATKDGEGMFTKHFWCPNPDGEPKDEDFLSKLRTAAE